MNPTDSVQLDEGDLKVVSKIQTKVNRPDQITTERIWTGKERRMDERFRNNQSSI